ncbi:hypothetical protein [Oceanospirillum sediminis]|uniref:Uncharacterized protein n=1 Tax=Oceanospirillum sediminis TaxID=2760088 RepID=A0A839ISD2_9GAMM|nr:hypothetical protein [Oceanospirillum sediminis]MBB1487096.1 hypothetical protein [Oceanospirillum sediminis]
MEPSLVNLIHLRDKEQSYRDKAYASADSFVRDHLLMQADTIKEQHTEMQRVMSDKPNPVLLELKHREEQLSLF